MKHRFPFAGRKLVAPLLTLVLVLAASSSWADDDDELTLASLAFFIEFNETDEDIGVQTSLGGEPYERLRAFGPGEI